MTNSSRQVFLIKPHQFNYKHCRTLRSAAAIFVSNNKRRPRPCTDGVCFSNSIQIYFLHPTSDFGPSDLGPYFTINTRCTICDHGA